MGNDRRSDQVYEMNTQPMHRLLTVSLLLCTTLIHAQQCDWLTSATIDYDMNPSMPSEVLASAPGRLVAARNTTGDFVYGQTLYGNACAAADLNGDGRVDVVCIGGATANLKWYQNQGPAQR